MPKRFFVTADTTIINGKLVLNALKKPRLDESQVVPDIDNSDINLLSCNNSGNNNSSNSNSNVIQVKLEIPVPGTKVNRRVFRKAGPYIIGPSLGHSPSLDCMVQYLARKENSKEFYQLKVKKPFKCRYCVISLKNHSNADIVIQRIGRMATETGTSLII